MRTPFRYTLLAVSASTMAISPLKAFVALGHGRLVGTVTARADYDSNIYVNSSKVDDYVGTITGGVRYIHDASAVTFEAGAGVTMLGFADHSDQNSADPYLDARFGYSPSDKTKLLAGLSYKRNTIANEQLNDRTKSNDLVLDGMFEHLTTEKIGFRLNTDYSAQDFRTTGYSDVYHYGLGVSGVYEYSPKLKLLASVTRLEWWNENRVRGRGDPSSKDWRYTVSGEGELAPKVSGEVTVGMVSRKANNPAFSDEDALFLSSKLAWVASEKTTFNTLLSQDLSLSAADQSVKSLTFSVGMTQKLAEKLTFDGSIGLDRARYKSSRATLVGDRKDDGWVARARLDYSFSDTVSFDVSSGYRDNDSNIRISDYDRFNFGVGATVRF